MKKTFSLLTLASILSIIVTSCATYQKDIFAKRKYYNFPRTKHSISNKSEELSVNNVKPVFFSKENNLKENTETSVLDKSLASANQNAPTSDAIQVLPEIISPLTIHNTIRKKEHKNPAYRIEMLNKTIKSNSPSSSDAMLVIEVILAIFLPPLGVYIKNNNAVNQWFWVTLLLCLLSILGFPIGIIGLFGILWFAAAIIALLYVFDVI